MDLQHKNRNLGKDVFQTGKVIGLSACHFIHDIYSSFLAPLLPLIIEKFSLSMTQAGLLSTVMQVPAIFNPYLGSLADRFNVRYFIILAPALTAVPMSLLGVAPGYSVLLILTFITGISVALFHVPMPVMIARYSGSRVGRGMSFYMVGGEFARTLGPMVAVACVTLFGLEGFYPIMIFGLIASGWLFFRLKDVSPEVKSTKRVSFLQTWSEIKFFMLPLVFILWARGFMHGCTATFLPTFLEQETGNLWLAGTGLAVMEGTGVIGALTAGIVSDHLGRRRMLLLSLLGAPVGLFLMTVTAGWLRFLMVIFTGFTLLSTTPVMLAMVQEHGKRSPAAANGLFMMASFLARSAIVVVIGWMADIAGLRMTYIISSAIGLLAIPFVLKLPGKEL